MQDATPPKYYAATFNDVQLGCVLQALEHELIRATARARDERLSDTARDAERDLLRVMRTLVDRLRRTEAT